MSELQASGAAAQKVIRDYHHAVKVDILRPVQLAKGMLAAYPCVLNTLAIGAVLGTPPLLPCAAVLIPKPQCPESKPTSPLCSAKPAAIRGICALPQKRIFCPEHNPGLTQP